MKESCDYCGRMAELVDFGKARVCIICKINNTSKSSKKYIKAMRVELDRKTMPSKAYSDYLQRKEKNNNK